MAEEGKVGVEGTSSEAAAWGDSIPQESKEALFVNNRFDGGKTPEGLTKLSNSYLELEKAMSSRIKIPGEDATNEEKAAFYTKLGRPESPDKYELTRPAENIPYDEGVEKVIREAAYEVGISHAQLAAMNDVVNKYQAKVIEAQIKQVEELNAKRWDKYRSEWGEETTKENIELAKRAFNEVAPVELKELMSADQVEQDPILVATYSAFWRKTMNDKLVRGETPEISSGNEAQYRPKYDNSPEMYRNAKTEENLKAKNWFIANGYKY